MTILAPHSLRLAGRPAWFFERKHYGGIITDIGSHQVEQFLYYAGLTSAEVVSSQVANYTRPEYPEFEDFGEVQLRGTTPDGQGCSGYIRVDWLIPEAGKRTGRHRAILGTEGFLEIEGSAVTVSNGAGTERIDCAEVVPAYGRLLVDDVLNRTETAMGQAHCFYASELTLRAQEMALKGGYLQG